jgi:YggT family protein
MFLFQLLQAALDFLIILTLLRLLIRPNEAFFHPIYRIIYRITDPILLPSRYLTRTPAQGIILTTLGLVVLRGAVYVSVQPLPLSTGIGQSLMDLFRLLFQAYMVMWVIAMAAGRGYGTPLIHMFARAFLPIDAALRHMGIPRSRFNVAAFFFLWGLYALLSAVVLAFLILQTTPKVYYLIRGLAEGVLLLGLFPFPGFFSLVIVVGALLSWVSPDPYNPIVQTIYSITGPLLAPFRRLVPSLGGLDISPILALLAFQILGGLGQELVLNALRSIHAPLA